MVFNIKKGLHSDLEKKKNEDTGTVTKISILNEENIKNLDNVQIHNLSEERSVGYVNYELGIPGKQNLEAASRKMVLNKSVDLITNSGDKFKKFRKPAAEIKELKVTWNRNDERTGRKRIFSKGYYQHKS